MFDVRREKNTADVVLVSLESRDRMESSDLAILSHLPNVDIALSRR